jgi:hypothetical protein
MKRYLLSGAESFDIDLPSYGMDFDPEETFQRVGSPKVPIRKADRHLKNQARASELAALKRLTIGQDRRMLVGMARTALLPFGREGVDKILGSKQGVSLITGARTKSIYRHRFGNSTAPSAYNKVVTDFADKLNQESKSLSVEIGDVDAWEAHRSSYFVALNLCGEGAEQVADEQDRLKIALGFHSGSVAADRKTSTPHISLVTARSQIEAETYAEAVQAGMQQLLEVKGVDTISVILGKVTPHFVDIP